MCCKWDMGTLTLITGPMFAGKTSHLIAVARSCPVPSLYVTSYRDTRGEGNAIRSHDGDTLPAQSVRDLHEVAIGDHIRHIFVDEGQFFDDLETVDAWADRGVDVTVSALISDHKRNLFANVRPMMGKADHIVFLRATCACGKPASFSKRLVASPDEFLVGGADLYAPCCRTCFASSFKTRSLGATPPHSGDP